MKRKLSQQQAIPRSAHNQQQQSFGLISLSQPFAFSNPRSCLVPLYRISKPPSSFSVMAGNSMHIPLGTTAQVVTVQDSSGLLVSTLPDSIADIENVAMRGQAGDIYARLGTGGQLTFYGAVDTNQSTVLVFAPKKKMYAISFIHTQLKDLFTTWANAGILSLVTDVSFYREYNTPVEESTGANQGGSDNTSVNYLSYPFALLITLSPAHIVKTMPIPNSLLKTDSQRVILRAKNSFMNPFVMACMSEDTPATIPIVDRDLPSEHHAILGSLTALADVIFGSHRSQKTIKNEGFTSTNGDNSYTYSISGYWAAISLPAFAHFFAVANTITPRPTLSLIALADSEKHILRLKVAQVYTPATIVDENDYIPEMTSRAKRPRTE